MGIETIIAVVGLAVSAASTGYEVSASRDAAANQKDAAHKQEKAVRDQNAALNQTRQQQEATNATRMARLRQRALLGSSGSDQTIGTSPLGLLTPAGATGGTSGTGGLTTMGQ